MSSGPRPRIGFLTTFDARTPHWWSGTPYHMARALQRHVGDVEFLGPMFSWRDLYGRVRNRLEWLRGRQYSFRHRASLAREYARRWSRRLRGKALDLLVAPAGSASIAYLETAIPIVYTSDTTVDLLIGYHPELTGIGPELEAQAQEIERRAIEKAALVVYPSRWAADSALRTYGADPAKVHVLPYGANIEIVPPRESLLAAKSRDICRLVFVGSPWERKGGPVACEIVARLRAAGISAELDVVGPTSAPAGYTSRPGIHFLGRLDKSDPAQQQHLLDVVTSATFMVLPTLNESYGIVFCEASACGTPSLAPRTGGVSGAVHEGVNGFLMPPEQGAAPYVARIRELLADRDRYAQLVESSRDLFERQLNWEAWVREVGRLALGLPARASASRTH